MKDKYQKSKSAEPCHTGRCTYMKKEYKNVVLVLLALVILKITFIFWGSAIKTTAFSFSDLFTSAITTENIVRLTNESRAALALNPLQISKELSIAAQKKAEDMFEKEYFSHTSADGKTLSDFLQAVGYRYFYAGENLAMRFSSSEAVLDGWLTSSKHKANIIDERYTNIGIGIVRGNFQNIPTTIIVQMFGKPLNGNSASFKKQAATRTISLKEKPNTLVMGISITADEEKDGATWWPQSSLYEIYSLYQKNLSNILDILYLYVVLAVLGITGIWFFTSKAHPKKLYK